MDDDTRKLLIAADSDPEFIKQYRKHCQIRDAAFKARKPMPRETFQYFNDNVLILDYLRMDEQQREELLAAYETEGETYMRHYCRAVKRGEQISPETIEFFNNAFQEIQSGTELKQALRIKKKRGRKQTDEQYALEKDAAITVEKKRADGLKWKEAVNFAAKYFHKDYETIKGYHKKNKKFALSIIQQEIENKRRLEEQELQAELDAYDLQERIVDIKKTLEADEFQKIMDIFQKSLDVDEFQDMVNTFHKILGEEEKFQKILGGYKTRY